MININITQDINDKQKQQLELIEALSNSEGEVNLKGLDDDMLAMAVMQLTIQAKIKENGLETKRDGTNIGIKRIEDTDYKWFNLTVKDGKPGMPGKKGEPGKPGKKGDSIKGDSVQGKPGKKGDKGTPGKPGVKGDSIKGEDGKSIEITKNGTSLGVRVEGDKNYTYFDLKGQGGNGYYGGQNADTVGVETKNFDGILSDVDNTVQKALDTIDDFKTYVDDGLAEKLAIAENLADLDDVPTARENLGLVAGGSGDIWVEKAGDTMTGALTLADLVNAINSGDYAIQMKSGITNSASAIGYITDTDNLLSNTNAVIQQWRSGGQKILNLKYGDNIGSFGTDAPVISSNGLIGSLFGGLVIECDALGVIWYQANGFQGDRLGVLPGGGLLPPAFVTESLGTDADIAVVRIASNSGGQSMFEFYRDTTNGLQFRPVIAGAKLGHHTGDNVNYKWGGAYFSDNAKIYQGNNRDSYTEYNGNYVINPKNIGSGGVDIQGHLAVGDNGTVDATKTFVVNETYTSPAGVTLGSQIIHTLSGTGNASTHTAQEFSIQFGGGFTGELSAARFAPLALSGTTNLAIGGASQLVAVGGIIVDGRTFQAGGLIAGGSITNYTGYYSKDVAIVSGTAPTIATGFWGEKQTKGTTNYGIVLDGDGLGADIVLGANQNARMYFDTDLVIDPKAVGSGILDVLGVVKSTGRIEEVGAIKTANYTIIATDENIVCDTSGGAFTITLPTTPETGRVYTIILDTDGYTLTVDGNGKNINGDATKDMGSIGGAQLLYNGTQWNIK